ncbi:MAG: glycogen synthase GlgA [Gammaproteobacteria bacterium]
MKILHVLSECYPLIKTGGLADYGFSLPHRLKQLGADVRLLIPGYGDVLDAITGGVVVAEFTLQLAGNERHVTVIEVLPPEFEVPVWLVVCPQLYERPGNPYLGADGTDWPDNAERFALFAKVGALLASGQNMLDWRADVVNCHDWQTGLLPAWLRDMPDAPVSVFTIHNLAYSGLFPHSEFQRLDLPDQWWHAEGVEFYGGISMLKAGIVYADAVTTVSRTYADEILTPEFGCGMDGVLINYRDKLTGILNGIDAHVWNPVDDPYLVRHYSIADHVPGRAANRDALFNQLDWQPAGTGPLFGSIGRLVEQKGIDLLVTAASQILDHHAASFVIIGEGQSEYIEQLMALQQTYPEQVRVYIGYSEELAHLLEAAADFFVMPSRYEPCGLNQLYSMRYGTPPVVHHVGGLADTVTDATPENLDNGTATGVVFYRPDAEALHDALLRAITLFSDPVHWPQLQETAMRQDFGWHHSATQYLSLYAKLIGELTALNGMRVTRKEKVARLAKRGDAVIMSRSGATAPKIKGR